MEEFPPPERGKNHRDNFRQNWSKMPDPDDLDEPEDDDIDDIDGSFIPPMPPAVEDELLTPRELDELRDILGELIGRRREALAIFEPMEEQERFFASDAGERIIIGGNRASKTTTSVVEIARAVTNTDPYDKYPKSGQFILVGRDLTHCAHVFYKKLFKPGAFKIIKDEVSGEWRTWRPNEKPDAARVNEVRKAPPLIPSRFYDMDTGVSWENKKEEIPKSIKLKTGWTMHFFSGNGDPPQGWAVAGAAFDEEIERLVWYREISARLLDERLIDPDTGKVRGGKFIWSATPQAGTEQLYELKVRAEEQREAEIEYLAQGRTPPPPTVEVYEFGMMENPYVSQESKDEFIAKIANDPDEVAVRVRGEFALLGTRIYPEFQPKGCHGVPTFPVPEDWCRYVAIDPGHQVCAAMFVAIPPPQHQPEAATGYVRAGQKLIYDELYMRRANAARFARAFADRMGDQLIRAFYFDHRMGRQTSPVSGRTNEDHYEEEFRKLGVMSEQTGHGFFWGSDDVASGIESVRIGLQVANGAPGWVVMAEKCKNLIEEMRRYSYRKTPQGVVTDQPIKLRDHLCDCWRYLSMANLRYYRPLKRGRRPAGRNAEILKAKRQKALARSGNEDGSVRVG